MTPFTVVLQSSLILLPLTNQFTRSNVSPPFKGRGRSGWLTAIVCGYILFNVSCPTVLLSNLKAAPCLLSMVAKGLLSVEASPFWRSWAILWFQKRFRVV